MNRRTLLLQLAAGAFASAVPYASGSSGETPTLAAIEARRGGRLGVFALDTRSGRKLAYRADERFLMCSMFKLPLAAAVLATIDQGQNKLSDLVHYTHADVDGMGHAPVTKAYVEQGSLSLERLCAAVVETSDNGGANLLLKRLGGPAALTRYVRARGDTTTRFDRTELSLNTASGVLDTTTPRAFVGLVQTLLLSEALMPVSRARLLDWMIASTTGKKRLRAGFPAAWRVGDKTGTGDMQTNDTAIMWPGAGAPIIVSALYDASTPNDEQREAALREAGSTIAIWAAKG